jgi:hypothetical protein
MLAQAARQQHGLLRQLLPAAAQAAQLQQERGIKLLEVGAASMYTRRAAGLWSKWVRWVAAPPPPADRRRCASPGLPPLQIFRKESRRKRKESLKVCNAIQISLPG